MSRDRDRVIRYWMGVPVTSGTRIQGERLDMDGAAGLAIHVVPQGTAAGTLNIYLSCMDNAMNIPPFDCDNIANMVLAPGGAITISANTPSLTAVGQGGTTPFARWIVLSFTPSASGTLWVTCSLRRLVA